MGRLLPLVIALAIVSACDGGARSPVPNATRPASPSASVRPTEVIDAASRTVCATGVLTALVDAINTHDEAAIGRLIGSSQTHGFEWVSMSTSNEAGPILRGPGVNEVDYTPEGARRILFRHSQEAERWTLVSVRAGEGPSWHGGVDAEVHFERRLADGHVVKTGGKTALSCIDSAIYVLSLGDD